MRKLTIHFTKNKQGKIFSKAIMAYEGNDFSHCTIEFRLKKVGEDVIYHSSLSSGVNFFHKELFLEENIISHSFELDVTDEQYDIIMKKLIQSCGLKYAVMQNFGIVVVDVLTKLGFKNVKNPWKKGFNCSELVYRHVLTSLYPDLVEDPETITPAQVYKLLKTRTNEE